MKFIGRLFTLLLASALFLTLTPLVHAAAIDENLPDAQALSELELRAQQANPRDQAYLYTELVHTMTKLAVKQIVNGDEDQANATLKQIDTYAHLRSTTTCCSAGSSAWAWTTRCGTMRCFRRAATAC